MSIHAAHHPLCPIKQVIFGKPRVVFVHRSEGAAGDGTPSLQRIGVCEMAGWLPLIMAIDTTNIRTAHRPFISTASTPKPLVSGRASSYR
jgi:hypothetical protein